jgi:hypothetical protein
MPSSQAAFASEATGGTFEIQPLTLDAESKMHEYKIEDRLDIFDDDYDRMSVNVWLDLYRRKPESCVPPFQRFTHVLSVETGAGRSPVSMLVQLLVVASAFDFFDDVVAEDVQSDDPENLPVYCGKADFMAHASRLCLKWFGREFIAEHGLTRGE